MRFVLLAFAVLVPGVFPRSDETDLTAAKQAWSALLQRRPDVGPVIEAMRDQIDPFFDGYNEDLDGPLDARSMYNEFGRINIATWEVFLRAKGFALVQEPSVSKSTLAPASGTPRARLDMRGAGVTRQREQCGAWNRLLAAHVALHNRILDFDNDLPAAERKLLVFGNIPHGLGNRLGAYVSYFLLCVVTKRACLIDDGQVVAPMAELFEAMPMGGAEWDWRWSKEIGAKLTAAGIEKTNFDMKNTVFTDATPETAFVNARTGAEVQWAAIQNSFSGDVFRSTAMVHAAFNMGPNDGGRYVNEHYAKVLRGAGIRTPTTWMTAGCVARVLFQPRQLLLDQLSPFIDAFEQHKFVVGIHIRLGFLVSGAGADGRVRLSSKVTQQIAKFAKEGVPADAPWAVVDDWIRRAAVKHPHARRPPFGNLLADTFRCAEHLAKRAVAAGTATEPIFFVATDAKPIEDLVNAVYGGAGSKIRVLTTPYQPKHSGNAGTKFERLKLAMDWQLLAMADQLVSVGSIQSTFSATAWHASLLPDQLKHINDAGECVHGGGSIFQLKKDYHQDDPTLRDVLDAEYVVVPKLKQQKQHKELR